jgi:hypothetical protein
MSLGKTRTNLKGTSAKEEEEEEEDDSVQILDVILSHFEPQHIRDTLPNNGDVGFLIPKKRVRNTQ